ncbi:MAG: cofactor-independent phosphoglycerate mutase [Pirellulaceae bacterium]
MKYAIIIPDGCADEPQDSLGGKTPLEAANVPAMDEVARTGVVGRANHVPEALPAGSDVANLSLLGYDPTLHYTGRAPLEAAAQGIALGPDDWAVRCNLVTIEDQIMRDFSAGHIASADAAELMASAQASLGSESLEFFSGVGYRNLVVFRDGRQAVPFTRETRTTPPHDLTDDSVADEFPRGPGSDVLSDLMNRSIALFAEHPVNRARVDAGKRAATNVWLWGLGKTPRLRSFYETYGVQGKMITAVDLLRGLAALVGWERIEVPGATGYLDTDYAAKGQYAMDAIATTDVVCVHVEAPDEASHEGNQEAKIRSLEAIDRHIVGPVSQVLCDQGDYRILVSPDHPTPLRTKTHSHGFVPFAVTGTGISPDECGTYDEPSAGASGLAFEAGWKLMEFFLNTRKRGRSSFSRKA